MLIYRITAIDSTNTSSSSTLRNILICNCKTLDNSNNCFFDQIQAYVNPSNSLVSCNCSTPYTGRFIIIVCLIRLVYSFTEIVCCFKGNFCQETIDFCSTANMCNLYSSISLNSTCTSLSSPLQYKCSGSCPSGFIPNIHFACVGKSTLYFMIIA